MTMKQCAFQAQDHFQDAKHQLTRAHKCIGKLFEFDLTAEQAATVLRGQAIIKRLESNMADEHVNLQDLFVQLNEALAQEATRRR